MVKKNDVIKSKFNDIPFTTGWVGNFSVQNPKSFYNYYSTFINLSFRSKIVLFVNFT